MEHTRVIVSPLRRSVGRTIRGQDAPGVDSERARERQRNTRGAASLLHPGRAIRATRPTVREVLET